MKKFFKDHLFQLIYLIPVSFIAIGSFVLNIYLNQFGIIDVALFDTKTIYIGFIACSIFLAYILFWFSLMEITGKPKQIFIFFINEIWKAAIFSFLLYTFLMNHEAIDVTKNTVLHLLDTGAFFCFTTLPLIYHYKNDYDNFEKQDKMSKIILISYYIGIGISTCSIIGLSVFISTLRKTLISFFYFGALCISLSFSIWNRKNRENSNKEWIVSSFFNKTNQIGSLDIAFTLLFLLFAGMGCLFSYSKNIFPQLPCNLGGGYYKYNTIILDNDSMASGKIIHSNSNYIYIIEEDNKLSQYPINRIKRYEIYKTNSSPIKDDISSNWEAVEKEDL